MDPTKTKLRVYNTLTRTVEDFEPLKPGRVNMFVCGPTVWDLSHIGHAKTYVAYDIMARYLRLKGFSVFFILNITDIDDKIINKAKQNNEDPRKVAKKYATLFFKDMKDLRINSINLYANASDHIPEIIDQIQGLIKKGIAYQIDGDVYYDTSKFVEYGKLSKQNLEQLTVHRIDPDPRKKNTADFALWKSQKPGEIFWESPWGQGRPGWHIEDTAITLTYFGPTYDLHGGGNDLIFPHHEAEIAQAEGLTGKKPLARYWLHSGMLNLSGRGMHKSTGNIIPIQDELRRQGPDALRVLYASTHYRSPLEFTEDALEQAGSLAKRFRRAYEQLELATKKASAHSGEQAIRRLEEARDEFYKGMDDDFNTPAAVTAYIKIVSLAEEQARNPEGQAAIQVLESLRELGSVLGVLEAEGTSAERFAEIANLLVELRTELRAKKQYDLADRIRERMVSLGLLVEDEAQKTHWTA